MKLVERFPASLVLLLTILPANAWGQEEGIDDEFAFLEEAMTDDSNNLILVLIDGREALIELSGFPIWAAMSVDLKETADTTFTWATSWT